MLRSHSPKSPDTELSRAIKKVLKQQQHECADCGATQRSQGFSKKQVKVLETLQARKLQEGAHQDESFRKKVCSNSCGRLIESVLLAAAREYQLHQPLVCKECQRSRREANIADKAAKLRRIREQAKPVDSSDDSSLLVTDEIVPPPREMSERFPGAVVLRDIRELAPSGELDTNDNSSDDEAKEIDRSGEKDLDLELQQAVHGARVVLILGPTGSGKTTLLKKLMRLHLNSCRIETEGNDLQQRRAQQKWEQQWSWHYQFSFSPIYWRPDLAIVSQFPSRLSYPFDHQREVQLQGDADEAKLWLGSVGLNSIPRWCQPHHALSTGEAYRADLARRLHFVAAAARVAPRVQASPPVLPKSQLPLPLILDDFAAHLDAQVAACCACCLGKRLRRGIAINGSEHAGAVNLEPPTYIASSHLHVTHWLQPDTILLLPPPGQQGGKEGSVHIIRNTTTAQTSHSFRTNHTGDKEGHKQKLLKVPKVTIHIRKSAVMEELKSKDSPKLREDQDQAVANIELRHSQQDFFQGGVRVIYKRSYSRSINTAASSETHHDSNSSIPTVVLQALVKEDSCTHMCDCLFDSSCRREGQPVFVPPGFPSDPFATGSSSGVGVGIGLICGPSGSSKSVLMHIHFGPPTKVQWQASVPIAAHFESLPLSKSPQAAEEACTLGVEDVLWAAGLPLALLPSSKSVQCTCQCSYHRYRRSHDSKHDDIGCDREACCHWQLSRAQQKQADIARVLWQLVCFGYGREASRVQVIDEFTSVLDRPLAREISRRLRMFLTHLSHRVHSDAILRLVLVGCHDDVVKDLRPHWVYDTRSETCYWLDPQTTDTDTESKEIGAASRQFEVDLTKKGAACAVPPNRPMAKQGWGWAEWYDLVGFGVQTDEQNLYTYNDKRMEQTRGVVDVEVEIPLLSLWLHPCTGSGLSMTGRSYSPSLARRLWGSHFAFHHYKSAALSAQAVCFLLLTAADANVGSCRNSPDSDLFATLVGFVAVIRQAGKHEPKHELKHEPGASAIRVPRRAHRTVVLPQWQGMGIGSRLSDAVAEVNGGQSMQGRVYYGQTVHPNFGRYRDASPLWRPTKWNHTHQKYKIETWQQRQAGVRVRLAVPRFVYSHVYIGGNESADKDDATVATRCGYLNERIKVVE